MHRSRLAGFIIDCQSPDLQAAARFWGGALGLKVQDLPGAEGEKYVRLLDPAGRLHIEVQAVEHESRVHLDIETDDIEAEVRRLEQLGASRVRQVQGWWVMQAPTGQRFCVVRAQSPDFATGSREWPDPALAAPARSPRILNLAELNPEPLPESHLPPLALREKFAARIAPIGEKLGAKKLGYNLTVIEAGKRAFPLHHHRVNEELFVILEGSGEVRIGKDRFPVRAGDLIACPPGGPETAHQLINTGRSELKLLAISTMESAEVVGYPDSGKIGVRVFIDPGENGNKVLRFLTRAGESVDYWEGE